MRQGRSEGLDPMIDPPAAAFARKPAPRGAFGRDYRRSCSERFRDGQRKVLVQSRQNENVGGLVGGGFRIAIDWALDRNSGEAKRHYQPA